MNTTYVVEYRFTGDYAHDWIEIDTFDYACDARDAYWEHIQRYKHADCRIREVKVISHVEERTVAEYSLQEF